MIGSPRVACIVGTRPDAIKMAPVVLELQANHPDLEPILISTGQHKEMLDQVFEQFGLRPDADLAIMQTGQTLAQITSRSVELLDRALLEYSPQYLLAQGDTSTTFAAALVAFYQRVPLGHVEAGLRTESIKDPFPEEFNRRAVSMLATHHFAPTETAASRLRAEGHPQESVFVTGNTGLDAVRIIGGNAHQAERQSGEESILLLTTHRRENWGQPQREIAEACLEILKECPEVRLIVPMHRNPQVREVLQGVLANNPRVELIEPPAFAEFVQLMQASSVILTDSGGIQEEAPLLGKPVLVLRNTTERPEGIRSGNAKLVGTDKHAIVASTLELLRDQAEYQKMSQAASPYGDGFAAARITKVVAGHLLAQEPG